MSKRGPYLPCDGCGRTDCLEGAGEAWTFGDRYLCYYCGPAEYKAMREALQQVANGAQEGATIHRYVHVMKVAQACLNSIEKSA